MVVVHNSPIKVDKSGIIRFNLTYAGVFYLFCYWNMGFIILSLDVPYDFDNDISLLFTIKFSIELACFTKQNDAYLFFRTVYETRDIWWSLLIDAP